MEFLELDHVERSKGKRPQNQSKILLGLLFRKSEARISSRGIEMGLVILEVIWEN
jgi:hypothetical protein